MKMVKFFVILVFYFVFCDVIVYKKITQPQEKCYGKSL